MKRIRYIFSIIAACFIFGTFSLNAQEVDLQTQQKVDHFFHQALTAKALGNYDEAFDLLQFCYALDSTNAGVLAELGVFFSALGEKQYALDFFRRAVSFDPTNYYYNLMIAELSLELGLQQDAIDIYNRLLALYPERVELFFDLANVHADNEQWQKAIDALNKLEANVGISEVLTLNKVHFYLMLGERERAINEVRPLIAENPFDPRFYILIGDLYFQDRQNERALIYYEKAREIAPDFPSLIFALINFHERSHNFVAVQAELQSALAIETLDMEAKMQLLTRYISFLHQNEQDLALSEPLFQSLFAQYPDYSDLNFMFANVLMMQDREEDAIHQFEIFIRANPDDPIGYEQLLRIAVDNEDLEKIITVSTQAIEHLPQYAQFYFYLGVVKFQQGRYAESQQVFKDGLQNAVFQNPALKSVFFGQVGDLYYHLDNKEAAFVYYAKALEANPMNLHVLNNYAYFLALERRDLDRAERMSAITIRAEPTNATFLDTYGWVLFQQGAYTLARVYLERAMRYSANDPNAVIFEQYGDVLYRTGEPERARDMWQQARELGGDSDELNRKIASGTLD